MRLNDFYSDLDLDPKTRQRNDHLVRNSMQVLYMKSQETCDRPQGIKIGGNFE